MKETVAQYLARGGVIQKIETGLSGNDMASRYDRKKKRGVNITLNEKERDAVNRATNP